MSMPLDPQVTPSQQTQAPLPTTGTGLMWPTTAPSQPSTVSVTTTAVVPPAVQLAAKRAFIRTLTRGYAGAIPAGGVTAAALLSLVHPDVPVVIASAAAWVLAPVISAFASWLSILSNGVPQDYTNVVSVVPNVSGTITTGE